MGLHQPWVTKYSPESQPAAGLGRGSFTAVTRDHKLVSGEPGALQGEYMVNGKSLKLWAVNVISFILFFILCSTGLINWLVLPRGYEARGNFLISLRHFVIALHEWIGLIFMVMVVIHIVLHWLYIKSNLKKYGILKL
jgi:hypothetical protein